jgi:nucleoside-diphosphate-sugar epimerase
LASLEKAIEIIGYQPKVGFAEGIKATFDWYRADGA